MGDEIINSSKKSGLPPGTLIHLGKVKTVKTTITTIKYNTSDYTKIENFKEENLEFSDKNTFYWVNINGLQDTALISKIGQKLNLHPLLLEDILNTNHRPKMDEYDNYLFFTLKIVVVNKKSKKLVQEQVSFVLGDNWLLSFQEQFSPIFDIIYKRLQENKGIIRQKGVDYLMYSIIDVIVDHYFFVSEYFNDKVEQLEEKVLKDPSQDSLQNIQSLKRQLLNFRRSILPLREAVASLQKYYITLIEENTFRYLRDVYEHLIHLTDNLDAQRDMLANIMDLYLSGISNKMNEVMKLLTVISTIFIPITFISGLYGMNFENMPELHWKHGYFITLAIMFLIVLIMIFYFKRKKWL